MLLLDAADIVFRDDGSFPSDAREVFVGDHRYGLCRDREGTQQYGERHREADRGAA